MQVVENASLNAVREVTPKDVEELDQEIGEKSAVPNVPLGEMSGDATATPVCDSPVPSVDD